MRKECVNYVIQADIVDINADVPKADDIFFVDTNVWYCMTYIKASQGNSLSYQIREYPPYVSKCKKIKADLYWCGLSMAELAHNIEKTERELYNDEIKPKIFRHNCAEKRQDVFNEIQASWSMVKSIGTPIDISITMENTEIALEYLDNAKIDGYDSFFLEAASQRGIKNIITDDGDFATVQGLRIFTANKNLINKAREQGKLISRVV